MLHYFYFAFLAIFCDISLKMRSTIANIHSFSAAKVVIFFDIRKQNPKKPTNVFNFIRFWEEIFFFNINTLASLSTKIYKNQRSNNKDNLWQFWMSYAKRSFERSEIRIKDNSKINFCLCPNECSMLHWWAKQKELKIYFNDVQRSERLKNDPRL